MRGMSSVIFGDLLRTIARETASASHVALRDCSKEERGVIRTDVILEKGYVQPSTHLGRRLLLVIRNLFQMIRFLVLF